MLDDGDDFVFTLSDDNDDTTALRIEEASSDLDTAHQLHAGKKRKRKVADEGDKGVVKGGGKKKKAKLAGKGVVNGIRDADDESGSEEEKAEEDDGALDPAFEFMVPGSPHGGLVEEFDAWGDDTRVFLTKNNMVNGQAKEPKRDVDVDEIVRRRKMRGEVKGGQEQKGKIEVVNGEERKEQDAEEEGEKEEEKEEEDQHEDDASLNFDDDELLAPDAFGAGAADQDEEGAAEDDNNIADHQEDREDARDAVSEDENDDDDDDNSSVASPTAHPDDLASSASEPESSVEDAEEAARRAAFFAPESDQTSAKSTLGDQSSTSSSFQSFSLSRPLLKGLALLSFHTPTPVQRQTIPLALLGKDLVASAVTGSGKTAAFLLPVLERLLYRPRKMPTTRVAILMPTRELAVQCYAVAVKLASYTDITLAQLVGGFSLREQEVILKRRPDVVIATPGRFIDHMRNSASFTIDTLEILVLDEADRMLEDGFANELNEILTTIPRSRQTMLFSATMTESVDQLIRTGLNQPVRVMVDKQKHTVTTLTQEFVRLRPGREEKRMGYLLYLCKYVHTRRAIVFFRQKKDVHRARIIFSLVDLKAGELHGSMTQEQRISAVEAFRAGRTDFLLATDLASRGLDIRGVETIINFEAPQTHDIYVHRVGRTARAGKSGCACTLAAEPDRKVVKAAVKAARGQGAKVVSRVVEVQDADLWAGQVAELDSEVEAVLKEEKEERQLAQVEKEVQRAGNLVEHRDEILARPKRTWFETEREKRAAAVKSKLVGKGEDGAGGGKKRKLSGKEKKRLDDRRERVEGGLQNGGAGRPGMWRKGKGSEEAVKRERVERKKKATLVKKKQERSTGRAVGGNKVRRPSAPRQGRKR